MSTTSAMSFKKRHIEVGTIQPVLGKCRPVKDNQEKSLTKKGNTTSQRQQNPSTLSRVELTVFL